MFVSREQGHRAHEHEHEHEHTSTEEGSTVMPLNGKIAIVGVAALLIVVNPWNLMPFSIQVILLGLLAIVGGTWIVSWEQSAAEEREREENERRWHEQQYGSGSRPPDNQQEPPEHT